jgi:hypothetical protein
MNRAQELADWPIEAPTTEAGKRAAELHAAWSKQHARIANVEREYLDAQKAV